MKTARRPFILALLAAGWLAVPAVRAADPATSAPLSAADVVALIREPPTNSGFRARVRLEYTAPDLAEPVVRKLTIRGMRDGRTDAAVFQVTWPKTVRGRALFIRKGADGGPTGFLFTPPDRIEPLTVDTMTNRLFDSGIAIEDLAERFWQWPDARDAGSEKVLKKDCRIVELSPPPAATGRCSRVKAWIAPELPLAMRIEKYDASGALALVCTAEKITRSEGRWVAPLRAFASADGKSRTTIEGESGDQDLKFNPDDFVPGNVSARLIREFREASSP